MDSDDIWEGANKKNKDNPSNDFKTKNGMGKNKESERNANYRVIINGILFEWDTLKNEITQKKHGVSFEEAATIFSNENTLIIYDEEHSDVDEERYNAIGYSAKCRALIVCHCYKEDNEIIRVITARKANKEEIEYFQHMQSEV